MSKGTQMRKFRTFKEAAQKIVIKKPWGVEVKSYKAGDPIPAGVEFKIFDANDTAKIEAYADGLDESADYQKERFKEPYYMYNESKKVVENKMVGIISLPVGSKFIDDSFGGKRTLEVVKHGNDDIVHVKEVGTGRKFAYDASTPGGNKKVEKIEESCIKESFIIMDTINGKPTYFHYGKFTGYVWGFDKKMATKFSTKEAAERMIEKMRQEGMLINSMKVVNEAFKRNYKFNSGDKLILNTDFGDPTIKSKADPDPRFNETVIFSKRLDNLNAIVKNTKNSGHMNNSNPDVGEKVPLNILMTAPEYEQWKKTLEGRIVKESKFPGKVVKLGSLKPGDEFVFAIPGIYDDKIDGPRFDIVKKVDKVLDLVYWYPGGNTKYEHSSPARTEVIPAKYMKESRIAKGYENLTSEERAKHLLSHPSSKYMNDLKSENITERAIRKAVKEMLGKPEKTDPEFITDVNEEGEAPAIANTTAEVANPELPLKLKESIGQKLNISLVRKAQNLKEVEKAIRKGESNRVKAVVDKSYKLSANEYDKFVYNFMVHTTYLSGEGGVDSDGTVHVVEITAPDRKTIYVDPEGYDYARYVGY